MSLTCTVSPTLCERTASTTPSELVISWSSMAVMMSPCLMPAWSAGLPLVTSAT